MAAEQFDEKLRYLKSLVEYPEETASNEYQSAVAFNARSEFRVKLVRHILGLANAGGGYIIIGFTEDGNKKLQPDPALDQTIAQSYETTRLCQSVDSFIAGGQRIELQVHKIDHRGRSYPVISIDGFKGSPFFCGKDIPDAAGKLLLKKDAIYIRDHAAKTTQIAGPVHWNQLLKVSVSQTQEAFLDQLRRLLEGMGLSIGLKSQSKGLPPDEILRWLEREKENAKREFGKESQ